MTEKQTIKALKKCLKRYKRNHIPLLPNGYSKRRIAATERRLKVTFPESFRFYLEQIGSIAPVFGQVRGIKEYKTGTECIPLSIRQKYPDWNFDQVVVFFYQQYPINSIQKEFSKWEFIRCDQGGMVQLYFLTNNYSTDESNKYLFEKIVERNYAIKLWDWFRISEPSEPPNTHTLVDAMISQLDHHLKNYKWKGTERQKEEILNGISEIRELYKKKLHQENTPLPQIEVIDNWDYGFRRKPYTKARIETLEQSLGLSLSDSFRFALRTFGEDFIWLQYGYDVINPKNNGSYILKGIFCAFDEESEYIHPEPDLAKVLQHNKSEMLKYVERSGKSLGFDIEQIIVFGKKSDDYYACFDFIRCDEGDNPTLYSYYIFSDYDNFHNGIPIKKKQYYDGDWTIFYQMKNTLDSIQSKYKLWNFENKYRF